MAMGSASQAHGPRKMLDMGGRPPDSAVGEKRRAIAAAWLRGMPLERICRAFDVGRRDARRAIKKELGYLPEEDPMLGWKEV